MMDFVSNQEIVQFLRKEAGECGETVRWYWPKGKRRKALERKKMGILAANTYENLIMIMTEFIEDLQDGISTDEVELKVKGKDALIWGQILATHLQAMEQAVTQRKKLNGYANTED
jgi:hypothetical protein